MTTKDELTLPDRVIEALIGGICRDIRSRFELLEIELSNEELDFIIEMTARIVCAVAMDEDEGDTE